LESHWKPFRRPDRQPVLLVDYEIGLGRLIARVLTEEGYDARLESPGRQRARRGALADLDAGADNYLVKPFAFDELLARLRPRCAVEAGLLE
jgi:DNA-binding response OmpR family regulator